MPTGLYKNGSLIETGKNSRLVITNLAILKTYSGLTTKKKKQNAELRAFTHIKSRKKIDCFNVDGYCDHCKTVFEAMGCYNFSCPCQETCPSLSDVDIDRGNKNREMDDLRREYIRKKGYKSKRCRNVSRRETSKRTKKSRTISDPHLPTKILSLLNLY